MYTDVTITADEFRDIHNALCGLDTAKNSGDISRHVDAIRTALTNAYSQESRVFDQRSDHYHTVRKSLGLSTYWSLFNISDLGEPHIYQGVSTVTYKYFGGVAVKQINGNTWAALYVAANACIRDSGDDHHVFIEDFTREGNTLLLSTGS